MKVILIFILSTRLSAAVVTECGEYRLRGQVSGDGKEFIVLKETRSEMHFTFPGKDLETIIGLKDYGIEMNALIKKKMDGMKGKLEEISNVHVIALDPIQSHRDIELLKSAKCSL